MTREPAAPPTVWADANLGMTADWFARRVGGCRSLAHCRAALEAEAQRPEPRRERIAQLNQQAERIKRVGER